MEAEQPDKRATRQIERNTERIDAHAALLADLSARMNITELQAERIWGQLGENEKKAEERHLEVLGAIHELKADGRELQTKFEHRSKLAGKILATGALLSAGMWTTWQLITAMARLLDGGIQ